MRTANTRSRLLGGFTLTDTAVAIAIMGTVLCLLVPLFLHGTGVKESHARRNAQELCSICFEAQRAGVNFVVGSEVGSTLQNMLRGGQASSGRSFKATGITNDDAAAASRFLRVEGGNLVLDFNGRS